MNSINRVNGVKELQYVNPLTLEAQMFANSLHKYGPEFNLIDKVLCAALEDVTKAIDQFLNQNPQMICETKNTKIAEIPQNYHFDMIYCCKFCQEKFKNPKIAAQHLSQHLEKKNISQQPCDNDNQNKNLQTITTQNHAINETINQSIKRKSRRARKERKPEFILPKKIKSLFQRDLREFILSSIRTGEKLKKLPEYDKIILDLNSIIRPYFPSNTVIKTYFFGSRIYGLGQVYSDLDIFIDIDGKFNNFENKPTKETLNNFRTVSNALKISKSKVFRLLESVEKARVPVLKVNHREFNIDCDLSFSNGFGYTKTALVKYLFELQPIVKYMCIVLKRWHEIAKINHLSSYSLILLLIGFSQIRNILPSVESLQRIVTQTNQTCPWITVFAEKSLDDLKLPKLEPTVLDCKKYMKEFFRFYASFNFNEFILCPYYGSIADKKRVHSMMPERYSAYCKLNGEDSYLNLSHMTIQDPIQLNHNLTKGLSLKSVEQFKEYCKLSAELLKEF